MSEKEKFNPDLFKEGERFRLRDERGSMPRREFTKEYLPRRTMQRYSQGPNFCKDEGMSFCMASSIKRPQDHCRYFIKHSFALKCSFDVNGDDHNCDCFKAQDASYDAGSLKAGTVLGGGGFIGEESLYQFEEEMPRRIGDSSYGDVLGSSGKKFKLPDKFDIDKLLKDQFSKK